MVKYRADMCRYLESFNPKTKPINHETKRIIATDSKLKQCLLTNISLQSTHCSGDEPQQKLGSPTAWWCDASFERPGDQWSATKQALPVFGQLPSTKAP